MLGTAYFVQFVFSDFTCVSLRSQTNFFLISLFRLNESTAASKHGMGEQKDEDVPLTNPAC